MAEEETVVEKKGKKPKAEKLDHTNYKNKQEAAKAALLLVKKNYGEESIAFFGDSPAHDIAATQTGSLGLDIALGVGGYPRGRIIEIYGPEHSGKTTLTLHAMAQAQKAGGMVAFIDAEHALDATYATALGVDMDAVAFSQPGSGEEALDICETLVSSGAFDIIVIDSVAALTPLAEIQGEMGDYHVGVQARLMSQALRKLVHAVSITKTTLIFINQIRMKIGVMFGCFHGDTLVSFANGTSHRISDVVKNQLPGPVTAWDEVEKKFVSADIIDWHDNGKVEVASDFIHVQTESVDGAGRFGFTLTPDHQVLTEAGWRTAKTLSVIDNLITKYSSRMNGTFANFVWGTLVGDSHLAVRDKSTACLKFQDSKNLEYLAWKAGKINSVVSMPVNDNKAATGYSYEWAKLEQELGDRDPVVFLKDHYSTMGLALWYMDDGHFDATDGHCRGTISLKRFKGQEAKLLEVQALLQARTGLQVGVTISAGSLFFNKAAFLGLCELVAPYVPSCMSYKLPENFRNEYSDFTLTSVEQALPTTVRVTEIRVASDRQLRQRNKYDITVAGHHTYLVGGERNGVVVHNSPETTTGGNGLKFYASQRLEIRKAGTLKLGEEVTGSRTRVKVTKNKVAPPLREVEFDLLYGKGISFHGELIDIGSSLDLVEKAGAWYSYQGERIGQGRDRAVAYLAEHPDVADTLDKAIRKHYRINQPTEAV